MPATSGNFSRRLRWVPILSLVVFWSEIVFFSDKEVRYLNFAEVAETLRLFADSALPGSNIADSDAWNRHRSFRTAKKSICMLEAKTLQTPLGGLELRKTAAFLFHEVILNPAGAFGCRENIFPISAACAKQNGISLRGVGRPVFAMERANSARIGANPCHRIRTGLQARAHVELQHDRRLRVFCQDFDGTLASVGREFPLMIMIARLQAGRFKLISGNIQRIGNHLPAVRTRCRLR